MIENVYTCTKAMFLNCNIKNYNYPHNLTFRVHILHYTLLLSCTIKKSNFEWKFSLNFPIQIKLSRLVRNYYQGSDILYPISVLSLIKNPDMHSNPFIYFVDIEGLSNNTILCILFSIMCQKLA